MQIHQLKPKTKWKNKRRVGRGGSKGTYSGRGLKGQNARAGRKLQPIVRNIIKRYPKLRGYRFRSAFDQPVVVNLSIIEKKFEDGATINPRILVEKKIIRQFLKQMPKVKILATGQISKKFIIEHCLISKNAQAKIEKAGGKIVAPEVLGKPIKKSVVKKEAKKLTPKKAKK